MSTFSQVCDGYKTVTGIVVILVNIKMTVWMHSMHIELALVLTNLNAVLKLI